MKVIATLQVDLSITPLGTRSRLADELAGETVLRRTVNRLRQTSGIAGVYVLCPSEQRDRCAAILDGSGAMVQVHHAPAPPWSSLVRSARKWSLDGWRGGIGSTTVFDEYTDCALLAEVLATTKADAVLSVPPGAVLVCPRLVDRMIEQRNKHDEEIRLVFVQSPPGLSGVLLDAGLVRELAEKRIPVGWLFSYKPESPVRDLIFQPCCLEVPAEVRFAGGRLIGDTDRSMQALDALLADHDDPDAATAARWLTDREHTFVEPLPREVEIELTTDDPYPNNLLRPRGDRVGVRGPIDPTVVRAVVKELLRFDDTLIVLGGFGDPLRHPQLGEILSALRPGDGGTEGVYGLAVRTCGVDLDADRMNLLIDHGVDIVQVSLDAWTPELYGLLHSPANPTQADLADVRAKLDRLSELRTRHGVARPITLPDMLKARDNVHEMDAFYDGWIDRVGAASITGFSHYGKAVEDRSVMSMAPAARSGCHRLSGRAMILANGQLTLCDQDLRGAHTIGSLAENSLSNLWHAEAFTRIRDAHHAGGFAGMTLCGSCDEWHRP